MFLLRYFLPNGKNLEGNDLSLRQCGVLVMSNRSVFRGLLKLNTHFAKGNVWQYDKLNVFRYPEIYSTNDSLLLFHNWWILKIMKRRFNKNVYSYHRNKKPIFQISQILVRVWICGKSDARVSLTIISHKKKKLLSHRYDFLF